MIVGGFAGLPVQLQYVSDRSLDSGLHGRMRAEMTVEELQWVSLS